VRDPGADLPVALAIASALRARPLERAHVYVGELSLLGEIRPPRHLSSRFEYAATFGLTNSPMLDPLSTGSWPGLGELVAAVGLRAGQVRAVG
jgi:DNA repair protein RadA/Sms